MPSHNHHRRPKPQVKSNIVASANTPPTSTNNNNNNNNIDKKSSDHDKPLSTGVTRDTRNRCTPAAVPRTTPSPCAADTAANAATVQPSIKGSWSALQQGGSALQWLSQKAQSTEATNTDPHSTASASCPSSLSAAVRQAGVKSRGAIEYLQARQAVSANKAATAHSTNNKNSNEHKTNTPAGNETTTAASDTAAAAAAPAAQIPKPRSHHHDATAGEAAQPSFESAKRQPQHTHTLCHSPHDEASSKVSHRVTVHATTSVGDACKGGMGAVASTLEQLLPGKVLTQSSSSVLTTAARPPAQHTTDTQAAPSTDPARASLAPPSVPNSVSAPANKPTESRAATRNEEAGTAPTPQLKATQAATTTTAESLPRGVRGRRRQDDRLSQLQRQAKEARAKHEDAMRTDPAYQAQFLSYQERQKVAHTAQVSFFHKYHRQEHLQQVHPVVTERLDLPMILDLIDQHDVVFVCTDTGSGKSTSVPRALLEMSPNTRVVSTQPRRTATVSIANRVAALRREKVGEDVGYWIRGEKKGDEQTRLWYMTSYTLLLRILETPGQLPFTHVVLDEFHERQPDLEVTVALLRLALQYQHGLTATASSSAMANAGASDSEDSAAMGRFGDAASAAALSSASCGMVAPFKLILMSATLNTEDWEQYFDGLRVATYKQSEPEHPIHDYFLEDICELLALDYQAPSNLLTRPVVERDTLERHLYIAQNLILFINGFSHPHHSMLVFLPGRAQVENLQNWAMTGAMAHRVDVVAWHSAVDLSVIESAMTRRLPNRQKVYLATDIAEVSITLPDVVYVIDLVLVKRPKMNKESIASILYPPLVTQWISKGSVAQRRGRIGRVQQGFYFCLFPAEQVSTLADYPQPPIENSRVDELALHCLQVVSNPVAIFSICHGQPLMATVASAMNMLSELGCILPVGDPKAGAERVDDDEDDDSAAYGTVAPRSVHDSTQASLLMRGDGNRSMAPLDEANTVRTGAIFSSNNPHVPTHTLRGRQALWSARVLACAQKIVTSTIAEYQCTFIGRVLQRIPVSPQPGMLIFFGFLTGLESLMILAAAVMSSLSPFSASNDSHTHHRRAGKPPRALFTNMARAMEDTENVMRDMCCGLRSDTVAVMKATLLFRLQVLAAGCSPSNHGSPAAPYLSAAGGLVANDELTGQQQQHVRQWCLQKHLSYDKLLAIIDLEQHIKFELAEFMPFRDVSEPSALLEQLDKLAAMVVVMTNVAFVSQALEVTSESNLYTKTQEMALGLFSDLLAVPDIHSPSCLRWQEGDIVIPVQLNLFFDKPLASFSTAISSPRQFWMSLLLFAQRLRYASFTDDAGTFHVFCITYCGKDRFMELDEIAGLAVLEFRRKLSVICATLRLIRRHRTREQWELEKMLRSYGLTSLPEAQREVITMLVSIFTNLDSFTVDEVAHDEDDLDEVSALSFALPH